MRSGRYFCPISKKFGFTRQIFMKSLTSNFTKVFPVRIALIYADRWTGGRTDRTKPVGALRYLREHAWKLEFCASVRKTKYHLVLHRDIVTYILKSYGTHKCTVWAKCRIRSVPGCTGRPRPWLWLPWKSCASVAMHTGIERASVSLSASLARDAERQVWRYRPI